MTDIKEIKELQKKARKAGRICNLFIEANGEINSVFYDGKITTLLAFAEIERTKTP